MRLCSLGVVALVALVSCTTGASEDDPSTLVTPSTAAPGTSSETITDPIPTIATTVPVTAASAEGTSETACERRPGLAFAEGASVTLESIGEESGLALYAAEYPLPGPTDGLWSQWGQGIVSSVNERHYSAVGDHLGPDGNSYLYEYEPATRTLRLVADVLSLTDHESGAWGYGKIHSQMVEDACGSIWAFTYWGTRTGIEYRNGYAGDLLLEIDPDRRTVASHGALVRERGVPSLVVTPDGRYLVGESVDAESDDGDLVVVDTSTASVVDIVDDPDHIGFRSLAVDHQGRVLFSTATGTLRALSPETGDVVDTGIIVPGEEPEFLRAATPLSPDGGFVGVSQYSFDLFAVDSNGNVEVVGNAGEYTASLASTPDGHRVFWMPGAHGDAWEMGAPVLQLDPASGEVTELVSLVEPFETSLGLRPGGSYSITYHEGSLIVGVNASPLDDDSGFGTVVLVVIEGV